MSSIPTPTLQGTVSTIALGDLTVHTYTAPDEGFNVNTTVFELNDRLLVVDAQLLQKFAAEAADVVESIGKPIDRFILSHNHGDHFSGFQTLRERFPGVQLAALPSLRDWMASYGALALRKRRELFGDQIGARAVVPDALLLPGRLDIAGVRFEFSEIRDAESEYATIIALPDHETIAVFDLVAERDRHLHTVRANYDRWIAVLEQLRRDVAEHGYKRFIIGHGVAVGPDVVPSAIEYLQVAKEAFATSTTPEAYRAAIKARLPERGPDAYLEWASIQVFGIVAP